MALRSSGLYTRGGKPNWKQEFEHLAAQLARVEVIREGHVASDILVTTSITNPTPFVAWVAPSGGYILRTIKAGVTVSHIRSLSAYWTFSPFMVYDNTKVRAMGTPVTTASRSLSAYAPLSWAQDRKLEEGELVGVKIGFTGSPASLRGFFVSVEVDRGG